MPGSILQGPSPFWVRGMDSGLPWAGVWSGLEKVFDPRTGTLPRVGKTDRVGTLDSVSDAGSRRKGPSGRATRASRS